MPLYNKFITCFHEYWIYEIWFFAHKICQMSWCISNWFSFKDPNRLWNANITAFFSKKKLQKKKSEFVKTCDEHAHRLQKLVSPGNLLAFLAPLTKVVWFLNLFQHWLHQKSNWYLIPHNLEPEPSVKWKLKPISNQFS